MLEAEQQSFVLQTWSKSESGKGDDAANCRSWWCSEPWLFLRGAGLGGCPQRQQLCCKAKSPHAVFRLTSFSTRSWLNDPKVCGVGCAGGDPCEGRRDAAWGRVPSTQVSDELYWGSSRFTEGDVGGTVRRTATRSHSTRQKDVSEPDGFGEGAHSPAVLECSDWHLGD